MSDDYHENDVKTCEECEGTGLIFGDQCPFCEGNGKVEMTDEEQSEMDDEIKNEW